MGVIGGIRNIRSEMQIHPSAQMEAHVVCPDQGKEAIIQEHSKEIKDLTRLAELHLQNDGEGPQGSASYIFEDIEIFVPLEGLIDVAKELAKLDKEKGKVEKQLKQSQGKLNNEKFLANAPADVVTKEKDKVATLSATMEKIEESRKRLQEIGA
jgi:valyl-tRNA synthetase